MPRKSHKPKQGFIVSDVPDPTRAQVAWQPTEVQSLILKCPAKYILAGGARGGGKSFGGILWLLNGNQAFHPCRTDEKGNPVLTDISYIYNPNYTALVLRKDFVDLGKWIQEASRVYALAGGKYISSESKFVFEPEGGEAGATIYCGHLQDKDAWQKYQGYRYVRINMEELAQIEDETAFKMIGTCLSSPDDSLMRAQLFCSANPIGKGFVWVKNTFVRVKDANGVPIEPGQIFYERRRSNGRRLEYCRVPNNDPQTCVELGKKMAITKVFLPMRMHQNPHLSAEYMGQFLDLDDATRAALLEGDWDAMIEGRYFSEFRERPLTGEPPNACHLTEPVSLAPHWERWMGGDWGFQHNAAFYWACNNRADGRIHVYREFVQSQMDAESLGERIAQLSMDDLIANTENPTMTLYIGVDAFHKRQGEKQKSVAELIADGIQKVFKDGGALVPHFASDEALARFYREGAKNQPRIIIEKASPERIAGWNHIRTLFRWKSVLTDKAPARLDPERALEIMASASTKEQAEADYRRYIESVAASQKSEVLPKVLIWKDACPRLIEEIQQLVRDRNNLEDVDKKGGRNDCADAFRYLLYSHSLRGDSPLSRTEWEVEWHKKHWGERELTPEQQFQAKRKALFDYEQEQKRLGQVVMLGRSRKRREVSFQ